LAKKLSIFYSALLLTGVNLLLRVVGTSFQVYLSSQIGAEGIGLLQLVLSVGTMSLVAGTAGIRTATMYLTAEEIGKKREGNTVWVLSGCLIYSVLVSTLIAAILYSTAPLLAKFWISNEKTIGCLRLYAAFLPVNCLTGVMVGFYTGANRIGTLAAVEVAEQFCCMAFTVLLLRLWALQDAVRSCMAVILGSSIGSCMTLLCLVLLRCSSAGKPSQRLQIRSRLLQAAVPLAVADDLRTGISTVENLMVPKRLALFPGTASALASFGTVSGMVFPVLMFPLAILFGLTELLIPELARCNAAGSTKRIRYLVGKSLRITLIYGAACAGILFINAEALCNSLYKSAEAGTYLRWFSVLAVMLYCDAVTDAMIKGLGEQKASVRYNIVTNILDIILLYFLLPRYGIAGYFASFTITHMLNFALSILRLIKISGRNIDLQVPARTLVCTVAAAWVAGFVNQAIPRALIFLSLYFCLLIFIRELRASDFYWLRSLIKRRTGNAQ